MAGLNANIILGGRPAEIENPQNVLMRSLQIQQQRGALQNQERAAQEYERKLQDDNALRRELAISAEAGEDAETLAKRLTGRGFLSQAQSVTKTHHENTKTANESNAAKFKLFTDKFGHGIQLLGSVQTPEAASQWLKWQVDNGLMPAQQAMQYQNELAAQGVGPWVERMRATGLTAQQHFEQKMKELTHRETVRNNNLTNARGVESNQISRGQLGVSQGNLRVAQDRLRWDQQNPTHTVLDTVNGPVGVNPRTLQGTPVTVGGQPVPAKPTEASAKAAADKVAVDRTLAQFVAARDGLMAGLEGASTGPVVGRIRPVTAAAQTAEGSVAAMAPVLKQLFRVAGEGVFTDKDQELLIKMVPTREDKPEARDAKIKNIENIVAAKLGREIPKRAGADAGGLTQAEQAELQALRKQLGRQ